MEVPKTTDGLQLRTGVKPVWKQMLDWGCILLASPAVLIIGLFIALVIRLGSRGPIFFYQDRVGQAGRTFRLYKFRTMKVNAETDSHRQHTQQLIRSGAPMTKLDVMDDPRLIPFGSVLRATGLDELPQLINVLRGEMSLVGPRPCIRYEYETYEPWQRERLSAVPGLTGLWQVSGKNRLPFEDMVRLDIEYFHRQSLWLDLKIMARTLPALWDQCADQRVAKRAQATSASEEISKSVQSVRA